MEGQIITLIATTTSSIYFSFFLSVAILMFARYVSPGGTSQVKRQSEFELWPQLLTVGVFDLALVELEQHLGRKAGHNTSLLPSSRATWTDI